MPDHASGATACVRSGGAGLKSRKARTSLSALAIGAHAAAPRSATSAVDPAKEKRVRHEAGAYGQVRSARQAAILPRVERQEQPSFARPAENGGTAGWFRHSCSWRPNVREGWKADTGELARGTLPVLRGRSSK